MSFYPELDGIDRFEELLGLFDQEYPPEGIEKKGCELWYHEIAIKIAQLGKPGIDALIKRIGKVDPAKLRGILLSFSFVSKQELQQRLPQFRQILLSFLYNDNPLVAAEAIDRLNHLDCKDLINQIFPLVNHSSPYVVGSVLRFISSHDPEAAKPLLLEALKSEQRIIRSVAIDQLDEMECFEAINHIRPLLNDQDEYVREAANTAVANLQESLQDRGIPEKGRE